MPRFGIPPIKGARHGTVGIQQPKGPKMITKIKGENSPPTARHYRILSDAVRVGGNVCIPDNLSCVGVQWSICRPPVHRIRWRGRIRQLGLTGGCRKNPEDMGKAALDFLDPGIQRHGEGGHFHRRDAGMTGVTFRAERIFRRRAPRSSCQWRRRFAPHPPLRLMISSMAILRLESATFAGGLANFLIEWPTCGGAGIEGT